MPIFQSLLGLAGGQIDLVAEHVLFVENAVLKPLCNPSGGLRVAVRPEVEGCPREVDVVAVRARGVATGRIMFLSCSAASLLSSTAMKRFWGGVGTS